MQNKTFLLNPAGQITNNLSGSVSFSFNHESALQGFVLQCLTEIQKDQFLFNRVKSLTLFNKKNNSENSVLQCLTEIEFDSFMCKICFTMFNKTFSIYLSIYSKNVKLNYVKQKIKLDFFKNLEVVKHG